MMRIPTIEAEDRERAVAAAAAAARRGQLVGLPVDTAYALAADAFSEAGIAALRRAKARPDLAIPVMVPRIATVAGLAPVDAVAKDLMRGFWPGPLTLVVRAHPTLSWSLTDPQGRIAVRMPLHPVALSVLERTGPLGVVAAAAGTTPDQAFPAALAAQVAVLIDAGPVPAGLASAVVDLTGPAPVLVRLGPLDLGELRATCPGLVVPGDG